MTEANAERRALVDGLLEQVRQAEAEILGILRRVEHETGLRIKGVYVVNASVSVVSNRWEESAVVAVRIDAGLT